MSALFFRRNRTTGCHRHHAFFIAALLVAVVPTGVPADQLWEHAVSRYTVSREWIPFEFAMEAREYNGRGELRSHSRARSQMVRAADGTLAPEIVEAEQLVGRGNPERPFGNFPGSDDNEEEGDEGRFAAVSASPLDPAMQEYLAVTRLGEETLGTGKEVVTYAFELDLNDRAHARGTVTLDAAAGLPLRIEREVAPPLGVITAFRVVESFESGADHWLTTGFRVDVSARALMIERRIVMDMRLSDHRHDPAAAARMRQ